MQKGRVFLVGFPCDIKDIAHNRDGSSHSVNTDVGYHSEDHRARRAQSNRFIQNIDGQERSRGIANSRDQAQQAIQPNAICCTWDPKLLIE